MIILGNCVLTFGSTSLKHLNTFIEFKVMAKSQSGGYFKILKSNYGGELFMNFKNIVNPRGLIVSLVVITLEVKMLWLKVKIGS